MKYLDAKQLDELAKFDTPTVCNALERFNLRPKTEGFTSASIRSIFSDRKPMVGYACTAKISAMEPGTKANEEILYQYYQSLKDCPSRPIAVIEDLDEESVGSFWGEVQTTIHMALGCNGVITSGGVRDLDEAYGLGFTYLAKSVLVSHAYIHMEETNTPVTIGGLLVRPGDLLHADKHGAVLIPHEVAFELADACVKIAAAEMPVLNGCRALDGKPLDIEDLKVWRSEMAALRSK